MIYFNYVSLYLSSMHPSHIDIWFHYLLEIDRIVDHHYQSILNCAQFIITYKYIAWPSVTDVALDELTSTIVYYLYRVCDFSILFGIFSRSKTRMDYENAWFTFDKASLPPCFNIVNIDLDRATVDGITVTV